MLHYSCDRCQCMIDVDRESRYVVRIEIDWVLEPEPIESCEDDRDYLEEIDQSLAAEDPNQAQESYQHQGPLRRCYDLCKKCYQQFLRDPLAVDNARHFDFSSN